MLNASSRLDDLGRMLFSSRTVDSSVASAPWIASERASWNGSCRSPKAIAGNPPPRPLRLPPADLATRGLPKTRR